MIELMKLKDVAAALKVTIPTLYNLAKRGQIHFVKIGSATRISAEEVQRLTAGVER